MNGPLARSPKPEPVSEPENSQTDLPRRPHPDEFHERIENQLGTIHKQHLLFKGIEIKMSVLKIVNL